MNNISDLMVEIRSDINKLYDKNEYLKFKVYCYQYCLIVLGVLSVIKIMIYN